MLMKLKKRFAFNFVFDSTYFYSPWELFYYEVSLIGYISIPIYIKILFAFKFDFKEGFMHTKCHLLDSFGALATKTQNLVGTVRRREISRTGRETFVLSERSRNTRNPMTS